MKTMTAKKKLSAALGVTLAAALLCTAAAFAADSYESGKESHTVNGITYQTYSIVYPGAESRASTWVHTTNYAKVPVGYMGLSAQLCDDSGQVLANADRTYNTTSENFHYRVSPWVNTSSSVVMYGTGTVYLYTGSGYESYPVPQTARVSRTAASLTGTLEDGQYPTNDSGKTYGSVLLAEAVGEQPDLIAAVGTEGQSGYVLAEDLNGPAVNTPAEAAAYMEALPAERMIPLYDVDENVIGSFRITTQTEAPDDVIQAEIAKLQMRAVQADIGGGETVCATAAQQAQINAQAAAEAQALAAATLVNGEYPVNSRGETYGSETLAGIVGHGPDLIAAVGTEGESGYIRAADLNRPEINTPEEAMAYMETILAGPSEKLIPLYDSEGVQIGQFLLGLH